MLKAFNFVETLKRRQRLKTVRPEEITFRLGYIDAAKLAAMAAPLGKNDYGQYLLDILREQTRADV